VGLVGLGFRGLRFENRADGLWTEFLSRRPSKGAITRAVLFRRPMRSEYLLRDMAKLSEVLFDGTAPESAHRDVVGGVEFALELPKVEVSADALAKIAKEIEALEKELAGADARLSNPQFVEKAPPQVIEGSKARRQEIVDRLATLRQNVAQAGKAD